MKVTPIDETEYKSRNLWPSGIYPCTIIECEEGVSKNDNSFFKCKVQLFNNEGHTKNIFYYMLADGKAAWQLRAGAEAFNLLEKYRAGEIDADDFVGLSAYARVGQEEGDGQYEPKNVIKEFKLSAPGGKTASAQPAKRKLAVAGGGINGLDDDIPW